MAELYFMKYSGNVLITWLTVFNTWKEVLDGKIIQIKHVHEVTRCYGYSEDLDDLDDSNRHQWVLFYFFWMAFHITMWFNDGKLDRFLKYPKQDITFFMRITFQ